jgi:hypothetical protein
MLSSHLTFVREAQEPVADLSRLAEHLPYEWIERAVEATGTASIRRRRLPAEQVVWLVVALAMYRHWSISEVLDSLDLALPDERAPFVSKSAVAQARQRVGEAPLAWLFEQTARAWAAQDGPRHAFKGLSLWAMDGTTLRTADSPANREHFGAQVYPSGKIASYPQVRAVTLTAIPTHLVAHIRFGCYGINEMVYAKDLLAQIPDDSLTVFDRGFMAAEILHGLVMNGHNRHFLIPAKTNTRWDVMAGTADDATVRMRVSPQARKKCPALPEFWEARAIRTIDARGRERVLLTSLSDRRRFPRKRGFSLRPEGSVRLHRLDVSCLLALRARLHFKRNLLVFLQRLEAFRADFREMREQIFTAAVGSDEAEALCVIEPLDGTGFHITCS